MDLARASLRRGEAAGQSSVPSSSKNFKVAVRVRPLIQKDWEAGESQVAISAKSGAYLMFVIYLFCACLSTVYYGRTRT